MAAICARNAAKKSVGTFGKNGEILKQIFLQSTCTCHALPVNVCGLEPRPKLTTMLLLQTRRCTQRSSCTSRFTRRFPPRCLKSRWNHSMCSTNTHTTNNVLGWGYTPKCVAWVSLSCKLHSTYCCSIPHSTQRYPGYHTYLITLTYSTTVLHPSEMAVLLQPKHWKAQKHKT